MDPLTGYCFGGIMLNVDDDITTRFPWRERRAVQAGKSQRSVLALVITCALILGFGIPFIPLVGVDSAEGTEVSAASDVATVSAASDVATVSAENSLQNGSFEQPDVYSTVKPAMFRIGNPPRLQATSKSAVSSKNGNGDNDSLHMRTGEKVAAAEGSQFGKPAASNGNDQYAELNSNQASSLYQVVNTVPDRKSIGACTTAAGRARTPWRWWSARNRTWPP